MFSLIVNIGVLLLLLAALGLMLGFKEEASWFFRAALALIIGAGMMRSFASCFASSAKSVSVGGGEILAIFGIGAFALVGFMLWRGRHNTSRGAPRFQARKRALPPPPRAEEE